MSQVIDQVLSQQWFYRFELPDGRCTESYADETGLKFHADRLLMLNSVLDEAFPGGLRDASCLDLASHQGFYALSVAQRGLRSVTGVDVRQQHVDSANLIKSALGAANVEFRRQDVDASSPDDFDQADIVLVFGLIYHLEDPIRLLRIARALTKKVCVIETQAAPPADRDIGWGIGTATKDMKGYLAVIDEAQEARDNNLETGVSGLCLCPSQDALLWILSAIGFSRVEVVAPPADAGKALLDGSRLMVKATP